MSVDSPTILGVSLWLPSSVPAGASLALVCTIHAALGDSILEIEKIRTGHVLEV